MRIELSQFRAIDQPWFACYRIVRDASNSARFSSVVSLLSFTQLISPSTARLDALWHISDPSPIPSVLFLPIVKQLQGTWHGLMEFSITFSSMQHTWLFETVPPNPNNIYGCFGAGATIGKFGDSGCQLYEGFMGRGEEG